MWRDIITTLFDQLEEHWVKFITAAVLMGIGWYLGKRRERHNWEQRSFLDRVNVSLNSIVDGTLCLRTILEKSCEEVFLNQLAARRLIHYSHNTRIGEPIIPIPEQDRWYYLNSVLNEISEKFAVGMLSSDNQLACCRHLYLLCLTREAEGSVRMQKIRVMMIRKDQLLNLPAEMPRLENPRHEVRWNTLKKMAEVYQETPSYFLELELVIPASSADRPGTPVSAHADSKIVVSTTNQGPV